MRSGIVCHGWIKGVAENGGGGWNFTPLNLGESGAGKGGGIRYARAQMT